MGRLDRFGTAVNCIDGRAQTPVTDWMRLNCNIAFVDMITTPGAEQVLCEGPNERASRIEKKVRLSVVRHLSETVAVAGHYDCAANGCDREEKLVMILDAVETVKSWGLGVRVIGLYVNEWGSVEVISDSGGAKDDLRSFL